MALLGTVACAGSDPISPTADAMPATERDGGTPDGGFVDPCEGTWDWSTDFGVEEVNLGYLGRVRSIRGDLRIEDFALPAGAAPCLTVVHGSVRLEDVVLEPGVFPKLVSIEGDFEVYGDTEDGDLDRLEALESIGGMLSGRRPLAVESLVAVGGDLNHGALEAPALRSVGGDILLYRPNDLPALETVGGGITWYHGGSLLAPALATVGGDLLMSWTEDAIVEFGALREAGGIVLVRNDTVTELALPALETVTASIGIVDSPAIEVIDLGALRTVGALIVRDNEHAPELVIDGLAFAGVIAVRAVQSRALHFDRLERVGKDFALADIRGLSQLDLSSLGGVGGLFGITACPWLGRIEADRLAYVDSIVIYEMNGLRAIDFPALTEASGGVALLDNVSLVDFSAPIEGEMAVLRLRGNPRLVTLDGFTGVTALEVLDLESRAASTVVALPVLTEVESLGVSGTTELAAPRLATVDRLYVRREAPERLVLPALTALRIGEIERAQGLIQWVMPRLGRIDFLFVRENDDLFAFDTPVLTTVRVFEMHDNPRLSTCAVADLLARLANPPESNRLGGNGPCPGG